jgi:hypothetical protein
VDKEGEGGDRLLFNGNLFRRDSVVKSQKVLASLTGPEQRLVIEVAAALAKGGCVTGVYVESILSKPLFEKLAAAGVYDLNQVTNEQGNYIFVTSPSAFHKFVDPMVDDTFDMAAARLAAAGPGFRDRGR